jgi:glutamate dehydrogenase/leucine dehydrogenase
LDGGKRDKDAVIAPEVPASALVGQAVLGHQAHGKFLDTAGVQASGQGNVGQIGAEKAVAVGAAVLGVLDEEINRPTGAQIAEIVQAARGKAVAWRGVATAWTAA